MKILLVEPDRILGQASRSSLEAQGNEVALCRSAQSALDALDTQLPDIIILEIQLGLHNGIEFLYELRSYLEWQQVPVIVHTLNAQILDDRFKTALSQLGVVLVLYKPRTTTKNLVQAAGQFMPV